MKFEHPPQFESGNEHDNAEVDPRLEREEQELTKNLEELQEEVKEVDPEKLSEEDANDLRNDGTKILNFLAGISGLGVGVLEAARSGLENADSTSAIIGAIMLTVVGGLRLISMVREERREKIALESKGE